MRGTRIYYRVQPLWARLWSKYLSDTLFVHINKTAGSSIEQALGLPFQHRTAREFIDLVGRRRWDNCFTFAFVRNPWDKVASHYRYRVKTNQTDLTSDSVPFTEWVCRAYGEHEPRYWDQPKMFMPQTEWICDESGSLLVDFVGRFEHLERDFKGVCARLGRNARLPHVKSSGRRDGYVRLYDDDSRSVVAECFADDIARFGYSFGD